MKNYYNILNIFTNLNNQKVIDESTMLATERALYEAFEELEPWQKEMLTQSMCPEVFEVIM